MSLVTNFTSLMWGCSVSLLIVMIHSLEFQMGWHSQSISIFIRSLLTSMHCKVWKFNQLFVVLTAILQVTCDHTAYVESFTYSENISWGYSFSSSTLKEHRQNSITTNEHSFWTCVACFQLKISNFSLGNLKQHF